MENPKRKSIRQGDLLFIPIPPNDWRAKNIDKENKDHGYRKDGVIQEGEATGHHHKLEDPTKADVFRPAWGSPVVVVGREGTRVIHQEHGPVNLFPDTIYQVNIAREADPTGEIRQVVD